MILRFDGVVAASKSTDRPSGPGAGGGIGGPGGYGCDEDYGRGDVKSIYDLP